MAYRIVAILAGILALVGSEHLLGLGWYAAFGLCLVAYFCARYAGYCISERRAMKAAVDEAMRASGKQ